MTGGCDEAARERFEMEEASAKRRKVVMAREIQTLDDAQRFECLEDAERLKQRVDDAFKVYGLANVPVGDQPSEFVKRVLLAAGGDAALKAFNDRPPARRLFEAEVIAAMRDFVWSTPDADA